MKPCWCGAPEPEPFRPGYGRCSSCGTLVFIEPIEEQRYLAAGDDESCFYGRGYWETRVPEVHGLPKLEVRARKDLTERALFALERVLRFVAPGGSVLELGCAHGALTYLMTRAGLHAEGLEMNPWLIERAKELFGVSVHLGPLESCRLEQRYEALVAIDVLEHLPDPLATMKACRERLSVEGRLILQTPCYRGDGADWSMFLPEEHLFLFTADSIKQLLEQAGFASVRVEPSLFSYDMWITAAVEDRLEAREDPLSGLAPELLALFDFRSAFLDQEKSIAELRMHSELQREQLHRADEEIVELRQDQRLKADLIGRIDSELSEVRSDQHAKMKLIEEYERKLSELGEQILVRDERILQGQRQIDALRGDQQAKADLIGRIDSELSEVRLDQQAKEEHIRKDAQELGELRAERATQDECLQRLHEEIGDLRDDQTLKSELIEKISRELSQESAGRETACLRSLRLRSMLEEQRRAIEAQESELESLSSAYEAMLLSTASALRDS